MSEFATKIYPDKSGLVSIRASVQRAAVHAVLWPLLFYQKEGEELICGLCFMLKNK